jgi:hypothetical protein
MPNCRLRPYPSACAQELSMTLKSAAFVIANIFDLIAASGALAAGDCCCAHCGCACSGQKVCRLVCEEKKVDVICWGCKCEDFCVPGPSKPGCRHCECVCGDCSAPCDCTVPHAKSKAFVWTDWVPGCASIFTKKKLMQKIVTKTVPSYKWVVETSARSAKPTARARLWNRGP